MSDERKGLITVEVGGGAPGVTVLPRGTIVGDYLLEGVLAQGGFGQVYRASHVTTGRAAALKVLHAELCSAPNAIARFLREAEVMVRVKHPNVVELLSWGTVDDGRPYLAMELLAGTDLARVMSRSGRLAPERALAILDAIGGALAVAHAASIVHRDIKASNVFLADDGGRERVVLIDFGIAKLAAPDATDLTTSRQMVGTPVTMAPEQITGAVVDARTDVYGLGVLAFHLLTGRLPFEDESPTIVQYLHAHARRPKASGHAPLPAGADDVIAKAMAIDPAQRYPGAPSFVTALRTALVARDGVDDELVPRPAVAVLVEVRADDAAMEEPDEALLADLEALLPSAETTLTAAGFAPVFHSGNLLLTARPVTGDDTGPRHAAIELARSLAAQLDARPQRDPRVGFVVAVHFGTALCAGDAVRAGDLVDVAYWTPDPEVRGTVATRAALDGLPVIGTALSDSRVLSVA